MLDAARRAQTRVQLQELVAALESGDVRALERLGVFRDLRANASMAVSRHITAGVYGAAEITSQRFAGLSFDLVNPYALRAIESQVTYILDQLENVSARAIRDRLLEAFTRGGGPRELARQIRPLIGLHPRDAAAVDRYAAELFGQGLGPQRVQDLTDRLAARYLRRRALLIARTETIRAANLGRAAAWEAAAQQGLLDKTRAWRVWSTSPDERTCAICRPMDGQRRRFGQPFLGGDGNHYMDPPEPHPQCRCAVVLEFDERPQPVSQRAA